MRASLDTSVVNAGCEESGDETLFGEIIPASFMRAPEKKAILGRDMSCFNTGAAKREC